MIRARLRAIMLAPRKLTVLHLTDVIRSGTAREFAAVHSFGSGCVA
jgi:hypothetical protein